MRASLVTMVNGNWSEPVQVSKSLSETCNSINETCIINVFDCELSLKGFSNKLSEVLQKPFSVKELSTKKGEVYYRILLNPSYTSSNIDF